MTRYKEIIATLERDWPTSPLAVVCAKIVEFLGTRNEAELRHLTPRSLARAAGKAEVDKDILDAATILSTSDLSILEIAFQFVDDDDREFDITKRDVRVAELQGSLPHPETGELIADYRAHVVPYFYVSEQFIEDNQKIAAA